MVRQEVRLIWNKIYAENRSLKDVLGKTDPRVPAFWDPTGIGII
jgi:hypothetical protein